MKAALLRNGTPAVADELHRTLGSDEVCPLLEFLDNRLPELGPAVCAAVPCMYTTSPDGHFVLGFAETDDRVIVCSACSGHGFKFAPVIGEIIADLICSGGNAPRYLAVRSRTFFDSQTAPGRFFSPLTESVQPSAATSARRSRTFG